MATNAPVQADAEHDVPESVDVPEDREYEDAAHAELDKALVEAIEAAGRADNEYLEHLLRCELASLYYEAQLGV